MVQISKYSGCVVLCFCHGATTFGSVVIIVIVIVLCCSLLRGQVVVFSLLSIAFEGEEKESGLSCRWSKDNGNREKKEWKKEQKNGKEKPSCSHCSHCS